MFAVPNGGKRAIGTALKLKKEGARAGVPDVMFPCRSLPYCGLAIEFKKPGNKQTDKQASYMAALAKQGWQVTVCFDVDSAIAAVKEYLR